jgi:hypothetical protein
MATGRPSVALGSFHLLEHALHVNELPLVQRDGGSFNCETFKLGAYDEQLLDLVRSDLGDNGGLVRLGTQQSFGL